jgi:hypothetical protein
MNSDTTPSVYSKTQHKAGGIVTYLEGLPIYENVQAVGIVYFLKALIFFCKICVVCGCGYF